MNKIIIAPSTDPSPITELQSYIHILQNANADWLHCDIMDGKFVSKATFDETTLSLISKNTKLTKDVHLMVHNPSTRIPAFAQAGADIITFHYEACDSPQEVTHNISLIQRFAKRVGISIKPATPIKLLLPFLDQVDLVLIMSVEPGLSGQTFIPDSLQKIQYLADYQRSHNSQFLISVDGGINLSNVSNIKQMGANVIVSGSAIFLAHDKTQYIQALRDA